jgi:hypothetical protein
MMLHGVLMERCTCGRDIKNPCWGCHWREMVEGVAWAIRGRGTLSEAQRSDAWELGLRVALDAYDRWRASGTAGLRKYVAKVAAQELTTLVRGSRKAGHVGEHTLKQLEGRRQDDDDQTFEAAPVEAADHIADQDDAADVVLDRRRRAARLAEMAKHDRWLAVAMAKADGATMPELAKMGVSIKEIPGQVAAAMERARAALEHGADLAAQAVAGWVAGVAAFRGPVVAPRPCRRHTWLTFPARAPRPAGCRSARPVRAIHAGRRLTPPRAVPPFRPVAVPLLRWALARAAPS